MAENLRRSCPDVVDDFRIEAHQHSPADSVREYDEDGFWYECVLQEISLEDVNFAPWDEGRRTSSLVKLQDTGKTRPVVLKYKEENSGGRIELNDGNHRCNACRQLGYTKIPALKRVKRYTPPFPDEEMEKWRFYNQVVACVHSRWVPGIKRVLSIFPVSVDAISGEKLTVTVHSGPESLVIEVSKKPSGLSYSVRLCSSFVIQKCL